MVRCLQMFITALFLRYWRNKINTCYKCILNFRAKSSRPNICCLLFQNSGAVCGTRDSVAQPCTRSDRLYFSALWRRLFLRRLNVEEECCNDSH
jgi:hypothetical protein